MHTHTCTHTHTHRHTHTKHSDHTKHNLHKLVHSTHTHTHTKLNCSLIWLKLKYYYTAGKLTELKICCRTSRMFPTLRSVFMINLSPLGVSKKCSLYLLVLKFRKPSCLSVLRSRLVKNGERKKRKEKRKRCN